MAKNISAAFSIKEQNGGAFYGLSALPHNVVNVSSDSIHVMHHISRRNRISSNLIKKRMKISSMQTEVYFYMNKFTNSLVFGKDANFAGIFSVSSERGSRRTHFGTLPLESCPVHSKNTIGDGAIGSTPLQYTETPSLVSAKLRILMMRRCLRQNGHTSWSPMSLKAKQHS